MESAFSLHKVSRKLRAVVTGAGSGLGRCFALELSRRGIDTILISLPDSGAEAVAEEARRQGTDSIVMTADLTDRNEMAAVCREICAGYGIDILINNAGTGGTMKFIDCDERYIERIIDLNVTAVSAMTRLLLPSMMKNRRGYILNVSSMAAFTPIGFKTVYPASKRFILDFTRGLRQELSGTGISVSSLHPGPMKTNPDVTRRIEKQGRLGNIGLLSPEKVATKALDGMFKRKAVIIPGWMNKANKLLIDVIPSRLRLPIITGIISRELEKEASR